MDCITVITAILSIHLITESAVKSHSTKEPVKPGSILFGSQVTPTSIDEVENDIMIPPEIFAKEYVIKQKPLILREVAKQWPAFTKWTEVELKYKYGHVEVRIDGVKGKLTDKAPRGDICTGRDTLAFFLHSYQMQDVNKFLDSELPTPLYQDVMVPPPLGCGALSKSLVEVDFWMSSGGVRSMLRKNELNTITCVLDGSQEWKIVEPEYDHLMYEIWRGDHDYKGNTAYSLVDPENVDVKKYPKIQKIPKILSTHLHAGDCLYIPSGTWHTVLSMGERNMAVSFVFQNFEDAEKLELGECALKSKALPLKEVDPEWQYPGNGRMSKGNSPFSYYLDIMDSFFGIKEKLLRHDMMYKTLLFVMSHMPYAELHVEDRARGLYDHLNDIAGGKDFMVDMLQTLTRDQLRVLINEYIQPPIPENNCHLDYTYFSPEIVGELFENISKADDGTISKKKFVEAYVNIDGHSETAQDVWDIFADEETEMTYEGNEDKVSEATGKFSLFWREPEEFQPEIPDDETVEPDSANIEKSEDKSKDVKSETCKKEKKKNETSQEPVKDTPKDEGSEHVPEIKSDDGTSRREEKDEL